MLSDSSSLIPWLKRLAIFAIAAGAVLLPSMAGLSTGVTLLLAFVFGCFLILAIEWYVRRVTRTEIERTVDAYLKSVLDVIPEPVFIKDVQGRYVLINAAFADQREQSATEILGKTARELAATPEIAGHVAAEDQRVLEGECIRREELFFNPVTQKDVYRIVSKAKGVNAHGEAIIIGSNFNITNLRLAELGLRSALDKQSLLREYFQRMLDALPTAVFVRDCRHHYVMTNQALHELFGRNAEEIIGRVTAELTSPEQAEHIDTEEDALINGTIDRIKDREEVITDAHGKLRQLIVRKVLGTDADGKPVIIGTMSDITTLRRAEARWQFALEGAGDGVWDWNIRANIAFYSPRWKKMLGYANTDISDSPEERIKRIHPEDLDAAEEALRAHLEGRSPIYVAEYRLRCKNERDVWVLDRGQIMERDENGRPVRLIATYSDITQRKTFEEELRRHRHQLDEMVQEQTADLQQAKSEAEDASAAKSSFMSNMSHELRTPMHAILSFARLGVDRALEASPEKLRDYFERIRTSGERLMLLLNDLLDLSKLEAGRMDLSLQHVRLRQVALEAIHEFEAAIVAKKLNLQTRLDHQGIVVGDPLRLGQVARNLISNAIKFSPKGGTLTIAVATAELKIHARDETVPQMPAMELRISDDGIGIPQEEIEAIFESYVQSSKTTSISGGTGLGLSICKEIVMAHGGMIYARNRECGGAEFVVCIPAPLH